MASGGRTLSRCIANRTANDKNGGQDERSGTEMGSGHSANRTASVRIVERSRGLIAMVVRGYGPRGSHGRHDLSCYSCLCHWLAHLHAVQWPCASQTAAQHWMPGSVNSSVVRASSRDIARLPNTSFIIILPTSLTCCLKKSLTSVVV